MVCSALHAMALVVELLVLACILTGEVGPHV